MNITPEQWEKAKALFEAALEEEPERRASFLAGACPDDDLRHNVQQLLAHHDESADFLSDPALSPHILNLRQILSQVSQSTNLSAQAPATTLVPDTDRTSYSGKPEGFEPLDPMVGRRLGAYKLVRRLGYGGMATVYFAVRADDQCQKQVAVKLIRPELGSSEEILARFRTERQALAALDHPNIVRLLDGGSTEEGLPYLVMEHVEGVPIDQYCDEQKLSIEQRLRLFCEVFAAVEHAHHKLIIHRDLKPSNILVTGDGTPKLLDFGIAKVLLPTHSAQTLLVTETNMHRMTPAYASPEQVRGERITPACDIYCLGVVLYELLTGHRPYKLKQPTPAEIERAICEQEPENPSTAVNRIVTEKGADGTTVTKTPELVSRTREGQPDKLRRRLRGDLDTILLTALSKEAPHRYASAAEFSADIQRHLDHLPIKARHNTLAYRTSRFLLRHKTEIAASALIATVLLAAATYTGWEHTISMDRARAELTNERSRGRRSVAVLGFRNLSARSDAAWLSTALSEMLTTELAGDGKLRMISGDEVAQMKINLALPEVQKLDSATLHRIHRNLGSDFVVFGAYTEFGEGAGRQIRIDLRLQDAVLGDTIAAMSDTGSESNLSNIVSRVGGSLRQKLGIQPTSTSSLPSVKRSVPEDSEGMRLYSEGLSRMRAFDALTARDLLEKTVARDPSGALAHSALSEAWYQLGYQSKAKAEIKTAYDLAGNLPREQNLWIEGRYRSMNGELEKATEIYRTLFNFFPDNLEYGIRLARAQIESGTLDESMATIAALRKLPSPSGEDPRIDLTEADAVQSRSDHRRGLALALQAQQKGNSMGARLLVAEALYVQGHEYRILGELDKSKYACGEARQLFSNAGDRSGEARVLSTLGTLFAEQNDLQGARKSYERALQIRQQLGDKSGEANSRSAIANLQLMQRDLAGAVEGYQRSLEVAREIGSQRQEALTLHNLALAEKDEGHLARSKEHFQQLLPKAKQLTDKGLIVGCLINLATISAAEGDMSAAKTLAQTSLDLRRQDSSKPRLGGVLSEFADLELMAGELAKAEKLYSESLQIFKALFHDYRISYPLFGIGDIMLARGDLSGARKHHDQALSMRIQEHGDVKDLFDSRVHTSQISLEEGHAGEAEAGVRLALNEYPADDEPDARVAADAVLIQSLIAQQKLPEAQKVLAEDRSRISRVENRFDRIMMDLCVARVEATSAQNVEAIRLLQAIKKQTRQFGYRSLELEARLALGEAELKSLDRVAGRAELLALEQDARAKGFLLIARKAAAARILRSHPYRAALNDTVPR